MLGAILRILRSRGGPAPGALGGLRRRIEAVYPELSSSSFRLVAADEGQYNDLAVVDERLIFRFPRFVDGVARLPRLAHVLRLVQRHTTLTTPEPWYVSVEPPDVGCAFLGYPAIWGEPLRRRILDDLAPVTEIKPLRQIAKQLAIFLKELHGIPIRDVEAALPGAAVDFQPLAEWEDLYTRIRRRLFPHMRIAAQAEVAARFESFLSTAAHWMVQPALVHGDFGAGNWLYGPATCRVSGIVDFDSCRAGDPAIDLAAGARGPPAFVDAFTTIYRVTEAMEARASFCRSTFALQEALYGAEHNDAEAFSAIAPYQ